MSLKTSRHVFIWYPDNDRVKLSAGIGLGCIEQSLANGFFMGDIPGNIIIRSK
jgi:hypothetical protein